jgi:hypothetical protein
LHSDHDRLGDDVSEVGVREPGCVLGVGDVADVDAHGGHPGATEEVPGLRVCPAVGEVGAGDDLALHQAGEPFPDRRAHPVGVEPEEVRRDTGCVRVVGGVQM